MKLALSSMGHALRIGRKKLSRRLLHLRMRGQPEGDVLAAERKLRGVEQYKTLRKSDVIFVSYGKSGRTWLRFMISQLFRVKYDLPENLLLSYDNFHALNSEIPKTFFTHDNYIKDYTGDFDSKEPFYDKQVVLLVRDPRDVAVSQFFQWKHRLKPSKVAINDYPPRDQDVALFDFVMRDGGGGMADVVRYMNLWATEMNRVDKFLLVRYEDLRAHPHQQLRRMLDFMDVEATAAEIDAAVEFSSFENMKKIEAGSQSRFTGGRLKPRDKDNPDSYKVRRAKVGGYRDYFSDEEVAAIDARLAETLDPLYNYC